LFHFNPGDRLNFFRHLINDEISNADLHKLFSLLRSHLVFLFKNSMSALYPPLTPMKNQSDFPLHCDLYIPKILFNVFAKVANDNSGCSTFLRLENLFELLREVDSMPDNTKRKLKSIVTSETGVDRYEDFFTLLHDEDNPWFAELQGKLIKENLRIRFERGEGYMINDRVWMHGREKTNGGVSIKRLHRLVFNNQYVSPGRKKL